uniref:Uncharacterized protein n=1 Tax=Caenorhabditis japonica TaxID=281687 RepID=A0A8R1IVM9_CAEJA
MLEEGARFQRTSEALAVAEDLGDQLEDPNRVRVLQDLRGRVTQARADWNTEAREANSSRENERLREEVDRLRMLLITNEERGQPTQRVTPRSVQDESPRTQFQYPPCGRSARMAPPYDPAYEGYEGSRPARQYPSQNPSRNNSWDELRNQMYQVNPTEAARMIPQFDGTREGYSNFIRIYDALVGIECVEADTFRFCVGEDLAHFDGVAKLVACLAETANSLQAFYLARDPRKFANVPYLGHVACGVFCVVFLVAFWLFFDELSPLLYRLFELFSPLFGLLLHRLPGICEGTRGDSIRRGAVF